MASWRTPKDGATVSFANVLSGDGDILGTYRGEDYHVYTKDVQNSAESIVKSDGSLVAAYSYSDFGETEELTGSSFDNEICYTGAVYDAESGLYYMNARYYDPANGRFISQDTYRGELDDADQWHLYAYCANNPINYVDPSGHYRLHTWILADLIDLGLGAIGVGLAFNPVKYVLRKATHSAAARAKAIKEIYKTFLVLRRNISSLCRKMSHFVKRYFGFNISFSKLYRYMRGSFYGKVNGWVADQLIRNISVFFSIGSFVAAACDIQYNGYLKGRIWKLW